MIISVHIPKTAGSSFKTALSQAYAHKLCLRYEQRPLFYRTIKETVPSLVLEEDEGCDVVHGHFIADTISGTEGKACQYITWLRNPVERVVSHYNHWKRHPDNNQPISKAIHEAGMGLEEFAELDAMRNVQSFFLGQMKLDTFDFIGITEMYDESIRLFNSRFEKSLDILPSENCNPDKQTCSYQEMIGESLYTRISDLNYKDTELYECGLNMLNDALGKI